MTIRKYSDYGVPVPRPSKLIVLDNDLSIANHFTAHQHLEPSTVSKGSIAQSLGISRRLTQPDSDSNQQMTRVQIDLLQINYKTRVSDDLSLSLIVAGTLAIQQHSVLSTRLILSNSGILQGRDVLPRAHPNDGFVDVLEIDPEISMRQRVTAWRRSFSGSHLPHPRLRVSRAIDFEWSGHPSKMVADGVAYKGVVWLQCTVIPDAMSIYF